MNFVGMPRHYLPRTKFWAVGDEGIEPSTSSLSEKRSTDELVAQNFSAGSERRSTSELHAQGDEVNFIFRLRYTRQTNNSFFAGKLFTLFLKTIFNPNS